jgi:hypothetical protein
MRGVGREPSLCEQQRSKLTAVHPRRAHATPAAPMAAPSARRRAEALKIVLAYCICFFTWGSTWAVALINLAPAVDSSSR